MDANTSQSLTVLLNPPSSPPLPPITSRFPASASHTSLSSDPIFSDDTSVSDRPLEPRQKRRIRAPWYRLPLHRAPKRPRRELSRYVDSGVWLTSENCDDDDYSVSNYTTDVAQLPEPVDYASGCHQRAAAIVENCVNRDLEDVDLSALSLQTIPPQILQPLNQLILSRRLDGPLDYASAAPLTPGLRLFLSNNSLSDIPPELWTLQNITVLSLHRNNLFDISESIGKLIRLKELNLAGNHLSCLPWSLHRMLATPGQHLVLRTRPNPLFEPVSTDILNSQPKLFLHSAEQIQELENRLATSSSADETHIYDSMVLRVVKVWRNHVDNGQNRIPPAFAGSSRVSFLDVNGRALSREQASNTVTLDPLCTGPLPLAFSCVPSLYESILQSCRRSPFLKDVSSLMYYNLSPCVTAGLQRAIDSGAGMPSCSVCERPYIISRAEWIEYWCHDLTENLSPRDVFLPFVRRACSWGCAQRAVEEHT